MVRAYGDWRPPVAGDRAQVLTSTMSTENPPSPTRSASSFPRSRGSLRRGVARVPEEVDGPIAGEVLADGTERRPRLLPEGSDVEGKDLVEAPIAEVGVLRRWPRAQPCPRRRARGSSAWPSQSSWRAVDRGVIVPSSASRRLGKPQRRGRSRPRAGGRPDGPPGSRPPRRTAPMPCPPRPSNSITRP